MITYHPPIDHRHSDYLSWSKHKRCCPAQHAMPETLATHYLCTREQGHSGDYAAHNDKGLMYARWS